VRMRVPGIALGVMVLGAYAFAGEYTTQELRAIGEGRGLYLQHCADCHGVALKGAEARADRAPDLTTIKERAGAFSRRHVAARISFGSGVRPPWHVTVGEGEMPAWGGTKRALGRSDSERMLAIYKLTRYLEYAQTRPVVVAVR
jgi:mono/diheme cytochrome c family protein